MSAAFPEGVPRESPPTRVERPVPDSPAYARSVNDRAGIPILATADDERTAHLVCISTDVHASAALQAAVQSILPMARVEAADTSIVRGAPDADCVVLSVGRLYASGVALVRELRACGYARSLLLVVESPAAAPRDELAPLGVDAIIAEGAFALQLPAALRDIFDREARNRSSRGAAAVTASLRRLHATLALGETARGLQHRLNNPLAALLAEAQLLELEPLQPEHLASVRRIVELCRRVIDESRTIEGIPEDPGG